MADLEAVLADVSYLMAMEKSKCTPAARASKKIILPDPRYEHHGRGTGRPQIDTGDERESGQATLYFSHYIILPLFLACWSSIFVYLT